MVYTCCVIRVVGFGIAVRFFQKKADAIEFIRSNDFLVTENVLTFRKDGKTAGNGEVIDYCPADEVNESIIEWAREQISIGNGIRV